MNNMLNRPKYFGEILDVTFKLSKSHFVNFMKIYFLLIAPIYILDAIINLSLGMSFFRQTGSGSNWFERLLTGFEDAGSAISTTAADIWIVIMAFLMLLLYPVAHAAILFAVNHIRKGEEYTVGGVIKSAFSRFWPLLLSNLLFFLILFGLILATVFAAGFSGVIGVAIHPIFGVLLIFIMFFGVILGLGLLTTRWSFYIGSVVLDKVSPGLGRSWNLSKGRTWASFGLYIIFYVIIGFISTAVELSFGVILGYSVLFLLISNLVLIFTTMIFSVGFSVMYTDLKARHEADDLKELLDDYNNEQTKL
ncbi:MULTISPECIES: hypothetical protein [Bacillaceae]|uniref:Glycerophosphoryl diester phosphodiesterase membrane domain-containing protein n=1 Tax=Evansella alkalicola TaxID=745819 RepID=A0ABS6JUW2_9BACI|nr:MULTISPECIES: hypothetical protein [Bacillaceae]MBU9722368.1 hypothetical protein [Bacillus alkalicola]